MFRKKQFLKKIEQLEPEEDHIEISRLVSYYDFPWDTARSLEFALFRTFAVPTIGELLSATHEFEKRPQKRYDDTDLILSEILENGYDSERGKEALRRMNSIHHDFNISNDDYLYVLSTFVMEPVRWNAKFGYRKSTEKERQSAYIFWREMGKRMNIKDVPNSYEELEQFNIRYEKEHFAYCEGGRRVADSTLNLFLGWYLPKWLHWLGRPFVLAIMDKPLLDAFNYKQPSIFIRGLVNSVMAVRAFFMQFMPLPKKPTLRTTRKNKTYTKGYQIKDLGAKPKGDIKHKYVK